MRPPVERRPAPAGKSSAKKTSTETHSWRSWIGITVALVCIAAVGIAVSTVPLNTVNNGSPQTTTIPIPNNVLRQLHAQNSLNSLTGN